MRVRAVIRRIEQRGGVKVRQSGSHAVYRVGQCTTIVPIHRGDLGTGLLRKIERDLEPCLGNGWLR